MKFGDIIENSSASKSNPQRLLMFVRTSGRYIETLSVAGNPVKFYTEDRAIFSVTMPRDTPNLFDKWRDQLADQLADARWWREFCEAWTEIGRVVYRRAMAPTPCQGGGG